MSPFYSFYIGMITDSDHSEENIPELTVYCNIQSGKVQHKELNI